MKVCIAGKNDIATRFTMWLLKENIIDKKDLVVCFNKSDNGFDSFQHSFRKYCKEQNLLEASLDQLYSIEQLRFFSLEFDRIIDIHKFASDNLYNIHFSLLPSYKGVYTSAWPLLNGEDKSGVTLHVIDQGIDTGDIIAQHEFPVKDNDNCRDMYFKYTKYGTDLLKENFLKVVKGDYITQKQSASGSSYYSKSSINYANLEIDLNKTAYEIRNQIRAFTFAEYQVPVIHEYQINSSEILGSSSQLKPGTILHMADAHIDITTIDYDLRLIKAHA